MSGQLGVTLPRAPTRVRAVGLRPRSVTAVVLSSLVGLAGFGWPLLAAPESGLAHASDAPWLFVTLLPLLLAVAVAEVSEGGMDAKAVALLGVLAAVGTAIRPLGTGSAGVEPIFFLLVLAGRVLGAGFGFVLGGLTLFTSALLTGGVGPWLPFQMMGAAWIGLFAGLLPPARGRRELLLLAGYGAMAGFAYGLLLNLSFWPFIAGQESSIAFVPGDPPAANLGRFVAFTFATSLGWDLTRAVITGVLVLLTGRPILAALRRVTRKAAFGAVAEFVDRQPRRVVVLGGARSGKSAVAERLVAGEPAVVYVATGGSRDEDPEWAERVAAHRARRPPGWRTVETTDLVPVLGAASSPVLVDCLSLWLTAVMDEEGAWDDTAWRAGARERVGARVDALVEAWRAVRVPAVAVTSEVGGGVVPATSSGRRFRDELGALNRQIAEVSDEVLLVVAGQVLPLRRSGVPPSEPMA